MIIQWILTVPMKSVFNICDIPSFRSSTFTFIPNINVWDFRRIYFHLRCTTSALGPIAWLSCESWRQFAWKLKRNIVLELFQILMKLTPTFWKKWPKLGKFYLDGWKLRWKIEKFPGNCRTDCHHRKDWYPSRPPPPNRRRRSNLPVRPCSRETEPRCPTRALCPLPTLCTTHTCLLSPHCRQTIKGCRQSRFWSIPLSHTQRCGQFDLVMRRDQLYHTSVGTYRRATFGHYSFPSTRTGFASIFFRGNALNLGKY